MRVREARDINTVFQRSKKVLFEVPRVTHLQPSDKRNHFVDT